MKKNNILFGRKVLALLLSTSSIFIFSNDLHANALSGIYSSNVRQLTVQSKLPKVVVLNTYGSFIAELENYAISTTELREGFNEWFALDSRHTFTLVKEYTDALGITHQSYQHLFEGYTIEGELILVHSKNNLVQVVNGQISQFSELNTIATISDENAVASSIRHFGVENAKISSVETVIAKVPVEGKAQLTFAKKVSLFSAVPLKGITLYIDAQSGAVINEYSNIKHADVQGSGTTYYRNTQSITVDSYNGQYRLKDNARNIHTLNGSNASDIDDDGNIIGATEYTSSTTTFNAVQVKPAIDVHWGIGKTYDYYKNIHNRNGFDNNNSILKNYYDAGDFMGDHANAGALDIPGEVVGIFYGRGEAGLMNPVVGLDIAGHEFSHLVVSRSDNGDLIYQGESGALNESFADIFATSVEFYTNLSPNWTIGEGVFISTPGYLRSMSDPKSASAADGLQQPDTYMGTYWLPNGYVHINSGVGNHWFYLLSVGGSGTNDINNQYNVTGITIQKAEKIAYRTLNLLTPNAQYIDAFNASKIAATDLYGANSNELLQVVEAWWAVGVGDRSAGIDENDINNKISAYPNPVTDKSFTINVGFTETTSFEIYDVLGKKVRNATVLQEGENTINVSEIQTGIYILKFNVNGKSLSKKLIIK
ncbi:M4 family metallopeptidase [Paenimyroides ceti]